jgi:hypothetical protein
MLAEKVGMRALHSTYMSILVELGFLGFFFFMAYLISTFRLIKMHGLCLIQNCPDMYYQFVALGSSLFAFLTASIFIDRFYAEFMFWFPVLIACFYNIYVLKGNEYSLNISIKNIERRSSANI